mgnify:FL=1
MGITRRLREKDTLNYNKIERYWQDYYINIIYCVCEVGTFFIALCRSLEKNNSCHGCLWVRVSYQLSSTWSPILLIQVYLWSPWRKLQNPQVCLTHTTLSHTTMHLYLFHHYHIRLCIHILENQPNFC